MDAMSVLNNFVEPFVERAILERRENVTAAKEAAGEKINFTDSLSQFTSDRKVLRDQLVSTLLAGRGTLLSFFVFFGGVDVVDTTACTLSWLFYELAYRPDIYAKLRDEVLRTLGSDGRPTYEDLKSMKYMQHCLNEGIASPKHLVLTKSPPLIPHCAIQCPDRTERYIPSPRRRTARSRRIPPPLTLLSLSLYTNPLAHRSPQRHTLRLLPLHHATPRRSLRPNRKRI